MSSKFQKGASIRGCAFYFVSRGSWDSKSVDCAPGQAWLGRRNALYGGVAGPKLSTHTAYLAMCSTRKLSHWLRTRASQSTDRSMFMPCFRCPGSGLTGVNHTDRSTGRVILPGLFRLQLVTSEFFPRPHPATVVKNAPVVGLGRIGRELGHDFGSQWRLGHRQRPVSAPSLKVSRLICVLWPDLSSSATSRDARINSNPSDSDQ